MLKWGIDNNKMTRLDRPIINQVNFNRELFEFLKTIFPDATAILKAEYYYSNRS